MPALIFILYFLLCLSFVLYSYVAINFCFLKTSLFQKYLHFAVFTVEL